MQVEIKEKLDDLDVEELKRLSSQSNYRDFNELFNSIRDELGRVKEMIDENVFQGGDRTLEERYNLIRSKFRSVSLSTKRRIDGSGGRNELIDDKDERNKDDSELTQSLVKTTNMLKSNLDQSILNHQIWEDSSGMIKSIKRAPHQMSSKIGRASTTTDAAFDEHERRMQIIEQGADRLVKDSRLFRDSVQGLLKSGADFGKAFETIFQPIGSNDVGLDKKNPASELTLNNITMYQVLMAELKDTLAPELDLIEGRVMTPAKEFKELLQRVRKTIVKRNHKLVDYDRFNNSLSKLREKKDKTMSDEKNLFKLENEFENAQAEYEHYNNLTKTELPQLYVMAQKFITPLFHSFYYMQLNIYYLILDKVQAFASDKYDLNYGDAESAYMANDQGANVQVEELTKRLTALSTGKFGAQIRRNKSKTAAGGEGGGGVGVEEGDEYDMGSSSDVKSPGGAAGLGRSGSGFSSAPPAYDASPSSASKRPPPPPPMKPKPKGSIVTALYDFEPQAEGDLGFRAGDQIEVIQRTESTNDWWTGRMGGSEGVFPGNYVQEN
ncbi:Reduced viability upon starvation protein [Wallemia ichthyophaga EXF-994]|uniref:Reduced viability upon starvation protein n=1 Tax=Wallemia ichthyophaga (strain EXF-994 / CBS 113033) TaxID=1299270 RepID=R9A9Y1_WALI9|nr:Reduced viability upon starvation protein [Wallemia ichthyophaga EXF-994]EOQ98922.1 Reduced viability upon starvation protein [Wallemia ichthyophaga EXF-994]